MRGRTETFYSKNTVRKIIRKWLRGFYYTEWIGKDGKLRGLTDDQKTGALREFVFYMASLILGLKPQNNAIVTDPQTWIGKIKKGVDQRITLPPQRGFRRARILLIELKNWLNAKMTKWRMINKVFKRFRGLLYAKVLDGKLVVKYLIYHAPETQRPALEEALRQNDSGIPAVLDFVVDPWDFPEGFKEFHPEIWKR